MYVKAGLQNKSSPACIVLLNLQFSTYVTAIIVTVCCLHRHTAVLTLQLDYDGDEGEYLRRLFFLV